MKADITVRPYSLRLRAPWRTATSTTRTRRGWIVRAEVEGRAGFGDATTLPGAPKRDFDTLQAALRRVERHGVSAHPHSALESALLTAQEDAAARRDEVPLARRLARAAGRRGVESSVAVNATITGATTAGLLAQAERRVRAGYGCLKIKAPRPEIAFSGASRIRAALGDRLRVRVDANGTWSLSVARKWLPRFAGLDVEYVEQPLPVGRPAEDWQSLRRLGVRVAADEELATRRGSRLLSARSFDVAVVKPLLLGSGTRGVCVAATEADVPIVVTDCVESAVGRTTALHWAAAVGDPKLAHGVASVEWFEKDVVPDPPRPERGRLALPSGPGLGLRGLA